MDEVVMVTARGERVGALGVGVGEEVDVTVAPARGGVGVAENTPPVGLNCVRVAPPGGGEGVEDEERVGTKGVGVGRGGEGEALDVVDREEERVGV